MIKKWLSCYNSRYPRYLVYMLQSSEYNVNDYLNWYHKVKDFYCIERRKKLVKTSKSLLLLTIAWVIVFLFFGLAFFALWVNEGTLRFLLFVSFIFLLPIFLAYGIIIPLFVIEILIQKPFEHLIINKAKKKLKKHSAFKIGIAGSFGKTTMREIIETVLSEGKKVASSPHNYNTLLGTSRFIDTLRGDEEVLIFELGEYYPGDIRKLCDLVNPDMGIITGINEAHLDKFKSIKKTIETIYELLNYLGDKAIYVNGENEITRKNSRTIDILYSRDGIKDWKINEPKTDLTGTSFVLTRNNEKLNLESSLLGMHQIGPLVVAVDISLGFGLSLSQIEKGIKKTKPFDHRLKPKIDGSGVTIIDDSYNGNPDGVKAVIEFLSSLKNHRKFYVTPGLVEMGNREKEIHNQIGRSLAQSKIEKVILIRNSVTPYIEEGLKQEKYRGEISWFNDVSTFFDSLPYLTAKGDVVLLQNDWPDQYQ